MYCACFFKRGSIKKNAIAIATICNKYFMILRIIANALWLIKTGNTMDNLSIFKINNLYRIIA